MKIIYRPAPNVQNRLVQSTTSAIKYSPPVGYEHRKFKAQLGSFPTQAFDQQHNDAEMKRSGDCKFLFMWKNKLN